MLFIKKSVLPTPSPPSLYPSTTTLQARRFIALSLNTATLQALKYTYSYTTVTGCLREGGRRGDFEIVSVINLININLERST